MSVSNPVLCRSNGQARPSLAKRPACHGDVIAVVSGVRVWSTRHALPLSHTRGVTGHRHDTLGGSRFSPFAARRPRLSPPPLSLRPRPLTPAPNSPRSSPVLPPHLDRFWPSYPSFSPVSTPSPRDEARAPATHPAPAPAGRRSPG